MNIALFLISLQENYVFTDKMSPSRGNDAKTTEWTTNLCTVATP